MVAYLQIGNGGSLTATGYNLVNVKTGSHTLGSYLTIGDGNNLSATGYELINSNATPPTMTQVTPNIFSAAGGEVFTITGTNLANVSSLTIAGQACTSVTSTATSITATTPAYSTSAGTSTGQAIVITTSGGTVTSSGTLQNAYYLPSTGLVSYHLSDVGITIATGVSRIKDRVVASANDWVQATTAQQPGVGSNFNGTGLPSVTFTGAYAGSAQYMTMLLGATFTGIATCYMVGNATSEAAHAASVPIYYNGTTLTPNTYINFPITSGGGNVFQVGNAVAGFSSTVTGDLNAHTFTWQVNGVSSFIYVDGTETTGTLAAPVGLGFAGTPNTLGCYGYSDSPNFFSPMAYAADALYNGAQSSADQNTCRAIFKARYGTP